MIDNEQWFELHAAYLKTEEWRAKHHAVMARDKGVCQAALPNCTRTAEHVHHLSYRHWRHEPLFDLVAVCAMCHTEITRMERQEQTERMLESYRETEAEARRLEINRLQELLSRYDPKTLDPGRLASYRMLESALERLTAVAAATPINRDEDDGSLTSVPLTNGHTVPAGG